MRLKLKADRAEMEKNIVFETLAVAQSMGWTIEYVMEMGIDAYNYVIDYLVEQKEEAEKGLEGKGIVRTLG